MFDKQFKCNAMKKRKIVSQLSDAGWKTCFITYDILCHQQELEKVYRIRCCSVFCKHRVKGKFFSVLRNNPHEEQ